MLNPLRILRRLTISALSAVLAVTPAAAGEARIAAATNFKTVLDALQPVFEAKSGHELILVSGATGKLYAQIVNGAPFDVFLAADEARPLRLEEDGAAVAGSRFTYVIGRLVLWDGAGGDVGPDRLKSGAYRRLALANPELAPYGAAARDVIAALGLEEATRGKLVYGENVGQAFAFVRTRNAELGFVGLSQILSLEDDLRGGDARGAYWAPPQELYAPIRQDAVLLGHGAGNDAAVSFLAFLKSEEAAKVMERYGYGVP